VIELADFLDVEDRQRYPISIMHKVGSQEVKLRPKIWGHFVAATIA
jgi:hypothetical protein